MPTTRPGNTDTRHFGAPADVIEGGPERLEQRPAKRYGGKRHGGAILVVLALLAGSTAAILATHTPRHTTTQPRTATTPSPAPSTAAQPEAAIPRGTFPLPGFAPSGPLATNIGVLAILKPRPGMITRAQALVAYDKIRGASSRRGRQVRLALARVAYLLHGRTRQATIWIVTVWMHPPTTGPAQRYNWFADHGFVNAYTGRSGGHAISWVPMLRPVNVRGPTKSH